MLAQRSGVRQDNGSLSKKGESGGAEEEKGEEVPPARI